MRISFISHEIKQTFFSQYLMYFENLKKSITKFVLYFISNLIPY